MYGFRRLVLFLVLLASVTSSLGFLHHPEEVIIPETDILERLETDLSIIVLQQTAQEAAVKQGRLSLRSKIHTASEIVFGKGVVNTILKKKRKNLCAYGCNYGVTEAFKNVMHKRVINPQATITF